MEICRDEKCGRIGVHAKHRVTKKDLWHPGKGYYSQRKPPIRTVDKIRRIFDSNPEESFFIREVESHYRERFAECVAYRNVINALNKLLAEGFVERLGTKFAGQYRKAREDECR